MSLNGKYFAVALAAALSGAAMVPSSVSFASPAPEMIESEVPVSQISQVPALTPPAAAPAPAVEQAPAPLAEDPSSLAEAIAPAPALDPDAAPAPVRSTGLDGELECLAKVVLHEAGNQSRTGQIAVAEVVMNRLRSPRFPKSICGVVAQRGQFFNVHAFNAQRDPRWSRVVAIARSVRDGEAGRVTNGAFFFRAHSGAAFPGRTRVATIGDHAFYR